METRDDASAFAQGSIDVKDVLVKLRDLPRKYILPDKSVDWESVRQDLGILNDTDLMSVLLYLYRTDATVAFYTNKRFAQLLLGQLIGEKIPIFDVPTDNQLAWVASENYCDDSCPGSEVIEFLPGVFIPRCGNKTRIERYEGCRQFRENLKRLDLTVQQPQAPDQIAEFEEKANDTITRLAERSLDQDQGVVGGGSEGES